MITKERLEELINKCVTVYMARAYTEGICLMPENFEVNEKELIFKYKIYAVPLEDLFETEEEAKWFAEFDCIERTERLELPTWEELFKEDRVFDCYTQEFGIVKNRSFIGVVLFGVDFTNEIVEVSIGSDQIFCDLLTKENYTLACRKAKELFLGEKK